ncbi:MAG: adenylate cyclase [Planctomycetota bacterium]
MSGGIKAMCDEVVAAGGWVVKSLGDGILTSYTGANAVESALAMVGGMELHGLEIRVGIHFGQVMEVERDIFGDAVNTAARIAGIARANEILISKAMWDQMAPELREKARSVPPVSVKGKREPLQLFSILDFDEEDLDSGMTMAAVSGEVEVQERTIRLDYGGQTFSITGEGSITFGRGSGCGIVVKQSESSRIHAKIFYRAPDFVLSDSSTNGTFLVPEHGSQAHILRRDTVLFGRGKLYPGASPTSPTAQSIDFEVS